jgi:hypothetical protein
MPQSQRCLPGQSAWSRKCPSSWTVTGKAAGATCKIDRRNLKSYKRRAATNRLPFSVAPRHAADKAATRLNRPIAHPPRRPRLAGRPQPGPVGGARAGGGGAGVDGGAVIPGGAAGVGLQFPMDTKLFDISNIWPILHIASLASRSMNSLFEYLASSSAPWVKNWPILFNSMNRCERGLISN